MKTIKNTINNEQGFVLIVSLLMLMVLMVIGVAATNTTTIELQISGNDKVAKQIFYRAESAVYEGSRILINIKDELESGATPTFVEKTTSSRQIDYATLLSDQKDEIDAGIRKDSTWIAEGQTNENSADGILENTSYRSIDLGASNGSSLSLNSSAGGIVHTYVVVGRYNSVAGGLKGKAMVELGLRIR